MSEPSWREQGFPGMTRLADARDRLLAAVEPLQRTEAVVPAAADGRVLAEPVEARRSVPHYRRAAMDGFAVRAADTARASDADPVALERRDPPVERGTTVAVQTGDPVPAGADAVVRVERTVASGRTVQVTEPVESGADVAPVAEDVEAGRRLFGAGHRLRPSDVGLLRAVGCDRVQVVPRPTVQVVPTGGELVDDEPGEGEVVETNGPTVACFVERWGGTATLHEPVEDDPAALGDELERAAAADAIVTTGGSSVGEGDVVPDVVAGHGDLLVHGVAMKPGHPVAIGVIEDTPVLGLPGYPVSTIVTAVQFLRPVLATLGRGALRDHPITEARLSTAVESDPELTAFERVRLGERGGERVATPVEAAGAGVLSSVALAHGWVVVPEGTASLAAGTTVAVEDWEPPC